MSETLMPGQFSCTNCHQAKRACNKKQPCGRCQKQGLLCVMQTRGRGRPPRTLGGGGGGGIDGGGSSSISSSSQHDAQPLSPRQSSTQESKGAAASSYSSLLVAARRVSAADLMPADGGRSEEAFDRSPNVSSGEDEGSPMQPQAMVMRVQTLKPPVARMSSVELPVKAAFVACVKALCRLHEAGRLSQARAACFRSVIQFMFDMTGESQRWARFSQCLGPEEPLPLDLLNHKAGEDSAAWAAELMFVPDAHCTRFILGSLNSPVNQELRCNKQMGDQFMATAELKRVIEGLGGFYPAALAHLMRPDSVNGCYEFLMETLFSEDPCLSDVHVQLRNRHGIFLRCLYDVRTHWLRQSCVVVMSFRQEGVLGMVSAAAAAPPPPSVEQQLQHRMQL